MLKDSIQTFLVTVDTVKHFTIPIETLFTRFTSSVQKFITQHKLSNDTCS